MGLDNGIMVKGHIKPFGLENVDYYEYMDATEICYWRRAWGLRDKLLEVTDCPDQGEAPLTNEQIRKIAYDILPSFMTPDAWGKTQSPWTYEEVKDGQINQIANLRWVLWYRETHPEENLDVFIYDSY